MSTTTYVLNSLAWAAGGYYAGWLQHKVMRIEKILKRKRRRNGDDRELPEDPEA